ncbi:hypothetical protein [Spirillospora sp. NPDC047279]|uniref:hypothetical protein n=1 Tax=Spirillospora sp. NPDC047279 TaxID=3155478 RepID=UPI0033F7B341
MPNRSYLTEFAGLEVVDFPSASRPAGERFAAAKADPAAFAWRLRLEAWDGEEAFGDHLARFIGEVDTRAVTALVIGDCWNAGLANDTPDGVRDLLVARAASFPALRALFFGEVVVRETRLISWIPQADVSALLAVFPRLAEFAVRGADAMTLKVGGERTAFRLAWNVPRHAGLRRLTFQTHRLDPEVVRGVLGSALPNLERLELFLGDGAAPEDLAPLLAGAFPALSHLGLRNAGDTDALVAALSGAPVTAGLASLDLSLGTLTDKGAQMILDTPAFHGLGRLDLHHHYMSEGMTGRLRDGLTAAGVQVDAGDRREAEVWDDDEDDEEWEPEELEPAITE